MGVSSAMDRSFFLIEGSIKTSGGGKNLAKGQLAIVDQTASTAEGAKVLSSFLGIPKDENKLVIRTGIMDVGFGRTRSDKAMASAPFSLEMVKKLRVSAPKRTSQKVDDMIIGFDGFDPSTSFSFKKGDAPFKLSLELEGGALAFRGGAGERELLQFEIDIPKCNPLDNCEDCDDCMAVDCRPIVESLIEQIRRRQVVSGKTVDNYVDVSPVFGNCDESTRVLIPYTWYTLSVCDTGTDEALSLVASQYDTPVIRSNRQGPTSTYQVLLPTASGAPADYTQTITSIIKGCPDCPDSYTEAVGGFIYAITIEDDGVDVSSTITTNLATAKYVSGTIIRAAGHNAGVGYYTLVYSSKPTDAEIASFLAFSAIASTATIQLVGSVASMCTDDTVTSTEWVEGDTCNATAERYSIVLPNDECQGDRLAELQGAFPSNTIYAFSSNRDVTMTGTLGTANVVIGGVNYLSTFDTDLTTTAENFVTTHAANILSATGGLDAAGNPAGVVVTSAGAVLSFSGPSFYLDTLDVVNITTRGTLTLTGTSGTANINVGGVDYLSTFNTTLTQTATDFAATHAAAILAATGLVVTSSGAGIIFTGLRTTIEDITITNATGNLAGGMVILAGLDGTTGTVTLTGTSGTANINVNGTNYLSTFASNLTTTAANFVTAHAAAILADSGIVVTSSGATLIFQGDIAIVDDITITNATGNLAGTLVIAVDDLTGAGCQNKYETTVISNLVCEECDPVFLDFYSTTKPNMYDGVEWKAETTVTITGNCLCGIRFRGKSFLLASGEQFRDNIQFEESSTRIRVAAGYPVDIREGIGTIPVGEYPVKVMSKFEPRTHLGGNLTDIEKESRAYFLGQDYRHDLLGRSLLGETSSIENLLVQYVQYTLEIRVDGYSGGFGARESSNFNYHFFTPVGTQAGLETLLNNLAANAGRSGVQAFAI